MRSGDMNGRIGDWVKADIIDALEFQEKRIMEKELWRLMELLPERWLCVDNTYFGGLIWKEYFEDLYNIDTQKQVAVHMCGFDGFRRGNYFGGEVIRRTKVEARVGKLKNEMTDGKNDVTGRVDVKACSNGFGGFVIWPLKVMM